MNAWPGQKATFLLISAFITLFWLLDVLPLILLTYHLLPLYHVLTLHLWLLYEKLFFLIAFLSFKIHKQNKFTYLPFAILDAVEKKKKGYSSKLVIQEQYL